MLAQIAEATALSLSSFVRGTSELIEDTEDESLDSDTKREGSEDKGPGLEDKDAAPMGQQQAVSIVDTAMDEPLGLGYEELRRRELALGEGSVPSTFKIGQSISTFYQDIEIDPQSCVPVQTSTSLLWSLGAQLELHGSILHDHTQRLDALPPTLFEGYDRDLKSCIPVQNNTMQRELQELRDRVTTLDRDGSRRG
nr:hypothetical protein [Tanacetum cinerariifolium]